MPNPFLISLKPKPLHWQKFGLVVSEDSLPQWQRPGPPTCDVSGSGKRNCWDHSKTFNKNISTEKQQSGCKVLITPCSLRHGIFVLQCCNIALISFKDSTRFLRHHTAVHLGQGPGWHNSGHLCGPFGRRMQFTRDSQSPSNVDAFLLSNWSLGLINFQKMRVERASQLSLDLVFYPQSSKKLSISRFPSETANKYNVSKRHPLSFSQTSKLQGCNEGLSMTFESALKRSGSCMQSPKMATHRSVLQCRTVHCLSSLHRHSYGPTSASLDQAKGQYAQRISVSHKHMACAIT